MKHNTLQAIVAIVHSIIFFAKILEFALWDWMVCAILEAELQIKMIVKSTTMYILNEYGYEYFEYY